MSDTEFQLWKIDKQILSDAEYEYKYGTGSSRPYNHTMQTIETKHKSSGSSGGHHHYDPSQPETPSNNEYNEKYDIDLSEMDVHEFIDWFNDTFKF